MNANVAKCHELQRYHSHPIMPSRIPFAAALLPCPVAALQAAESDVITAPRIESFPREGAGYALIDWRLPTKPLC